MQARFLIAATLIVLLALVSSRWTWVEEDDAPAHTLRVAGKSGDFESNTLRVAGKSGDFESNTLRVAGKSGDLEEDHHALRVAGKSGDFETHNALRVAGKSGDFESNTLRVAGKSGDFETHNALRVAGKSGDLEEDHHALRVAGKSGDFETHNALRVAGKSGDFESNTLGGMKDYFKMFNAEEEAAVLQQQGSLSANHQEAMDADALLNALIKRLTQQIADDAAATNQKISDRTNSIKKFDDAVNAAKAYLDDLNNQLTALNRKIDEAKTALAGRQGEKTAEQAAIDKENAEQRARLADRIAAVEKQIALIKQILVLLSNTPVDQTMPDSIILDSTQERLIPTLFANTQWAGKKYVRCYIASQNGYSAQAYNQACNGKAGLVTIIKSANGNVFGGFSSIALDASGNYKGDSNAFLFSLVRGGQTNLVKFAGQGRSNAGVHGLFTRSDYGPTFGGGHDIYLSNGCNGNTGSYSNLGHTYAPPSGFAYGTEGARTYMAGAINFTCADYEVFQLV